jgi:hypothetical protein
VLSAGSGPNWPKKFCSLLVALSSHVLNSLPLPEGEILEADVKVVDDNGVAEVGGAQGGAGLAPTGPNCAPRFFGSGKIFPTGVT